MRPIQTDASDVLYVGGPGIDDLPVEVRVETQGSRIVRAMRSRWRLDDDERTALILGADLVLDVFGAELPPVRPAVSLPPISKPELVYEAVDAIIARAIAFTIASVVRDVGYERTTEEVMRWSTDDLKEVSTWLSETEGKGEPRPAVLR